MTGFRKLQRLSAYERWLLAQAVVLLPLTLCGVYALGISRWHWVLRSLASRRKTSGFVFQPAENQSTEGRAVQDRATSSQRARAIARIVQIAAHHGLYRANCLQQSVVLWFLLRRSCIESEIRFGARKENDQLRGHAWVEVDGVALNEDDSLHERFSPFEQLSVLKTN